MIEQLHVAANERETVRVFALDLPKESAEALTSEPSGNGTPSPLADLLGVRQLDLAHVEVFPAGDLKGLGLAGYISEGLGVAPEDVAADRNTLDAATGQILIVHAPAFGGAETALAPKPGVRPLGAYRLAEAAPPSMVTPEAPGEAPAVVAPEPDRPAPPARLPRSLALLGLLAAAVVILVVAYLIGSRG